MATSIVLSKRPCATRRPQLYKLCSGRLYQNILDSIRDYVVPNIYIISRERKWEPIRLTQMTRTNRSQLCDGMRDKWIYMQDYISEFNWYQGKVFIKRNHHYPGMWYDIIPILYSKLYPNSLVIVFDSFSASDERKVKLDIKLGRYTCNICNVPLQLKSVLYSSLYVVPESTIPDVPVGEVNIEVSFWLGTPRDNVYFKWQEALIGHNVEAGRVDDETGEIATAYTMLYDRLAPTKAFCKYDGSFRLD